MAEKWMGYALQQKNLIQLSVELFKLFDLLQSSMNELQAFSLTINVSDNHFVKEVKA